MVESFWQGRTTRRWVFGLALAAILGALILVVVGPRESPVREREQWPIGRVFNAEGTSKHFPVGFANAEEVSSALYGARVRSACYGRSSGACICGCGGHL